MFKLLLAKEETSFGDRLAAELSKRYPLELDKAPGKISADRLSRILEGIYSRALELQNERKLGFYRKTRLCHAFKWHLLDKGYSDSFVNMATEGLVVYLSKPNKPIKVR